MKKSLMSAKGIKNAQKNKSRMPAGSVKDVSKRSQVSIASINKNYKNVLAEVNKAYSHGLSAIQKKHLKEFFLKNPLVSSGEVLKEMGYLSGVGKGKPLKK